VSAALRRWRVRFPSASATCTKAPAAAYVAAWPLGAGRAKLPWARAVMTNADTFHQVR